MTSSLLTSKSARLASVTAAVVALIATIAVAFDQYPAASTAVAVAASLLTIMSRDYAPRRSRVPRRVAADRAGRCDTQRFPLAV